MVKMAQLKSTHFKYQNVKHYFILSNGEVLSDSQPDQTLIITIFKDGEGRTHKAILRIRTWRNTVLPGSSMCYQPDQGAFIFPNIDNKIPAIASSYAAIILPPNAVHDICQLFENIIGSEIKNLREHEVICNRLYSGIITGAYYLSLGLMKSAQLTGNLLNNGIPKLLNLTEKTDRPAELSPQLTNGMQVAKTATNSFLQASSFLAEQLGSATVKFGQFIAPHIQKHGTNFLVSAGFFDSKVEASSTVKGTLTVAAGLAEGVSTVYSGLETSAKILGGSLKDNTVKIVKHSYGDTAGQFTDDALDTVGNLISIRQYTRTMRPIYIAKETVKETGKTIFSSNKKCTDVAKIKTKTVNDLKY